MSMIKSVIIPIDNADGNPSFTERVLLDNIFYDLKFDWNSRDTCWLMTISTPDGTVLLGGIKLILSFELIAQHKVEGQPAGSMSLLDVTGSLDTCGFNDLGTNCVLVYTSAA